MPENFFSLAPEDRNDVLEITRARTDRPAHLLEKDVWVVWTLTALFDAPWPLTSRSKEARRFQNPQVIYANIDGIAARNMILCHSPWESGMN